MKTLKSFESPNRPDFKELAAKMAFKDTAFLTQAWSELEQFKLCESGEGETLSKERSIVQMLMRGTRVDYEHAKLTGQGEEALRDGFIRVERERRRTAEVLYFIIRDGKPVAWKNHFESKDLGSLEHPKWANKVNAATISKALKEQRESDDEHIEPDEQVFDLEIHWEESRKVKLD
ncbi:MULTISPECIES: hypothetical protein [unclassified Lentimonas]|uniref:hypothetical protein n=1 Tax=unclassified Lentimonas TaxID=2630993 RepID=UPI00138993B6|nr:MULTISPECIES: hypothetical protein [unclassified Lentimonas]